MHEVSDFLPPRFLRSPFVQSFLASAKFRARGMNPMCKAAREVVIRTPGGPRLQGFYSPNTSEDSKGLVLLLHGWEGSVASTYILSTGRYFYENGYSVFRLNLRDHGDSHHLNQGLFFGTIFDEVFETVDHVASVEPGRNFFLAGFSLGGNYALRIARHCCNCPIPALKHIVAVSPVLDPARATVKIDQHPLFRYYFLKKWRRSLLRKQQLFPHLYDISDMLGHSSIWQLTEKLLSRYTDFASPVEYFGTYSLLNDALSSLSVPATIITSADDPIIPVDDFRTLNLSSSTKLIVHRHGGHNGFISGYGLNCWYTYYMLKTFAAA